MKKFLFTVCMLFSCVMLSMAQGDSYKIEGRLDNSVNGKLLLVANTENGMIDIGEAVITNGAFEFTGRMPETTLVYLMPVKKNYIGSHDVGECSLHDYHGHQRTARGK